MDYHRQRGQAWLEVARHLAFVKGVPLAAIRTNHMYAFGTTGHSVSDGWRVLLAKLNDAPPAVRQP